MYANINEVWNNDFVDNINKINKYNNIVNNNNI